MVYRKLTCPCNTTNRYVRLSVSMGTTGQPISSDTNLLFKCNNGKSMCEYQQLNFLNLDFVQFLSFYGQRSVYLLIQFVLENVKLLLFLIE